jgi:hypothetical protein
MLRNISCPTCGAPGLEASQPDSIVICKSCGNKFAEDNRVACPACEAINAQTAAFCSECGARLSRLCAACGAENWAGADHCATCGRDLDAIAAMAERHSEGFKGTLHRQRELANLIKDEEERSSQRRLSDMWEVENRRQAMLARQAAENRRQQSVLAAFVTIGLLAVLAIGVFAALAMLR